MCRNIGIRPSAPYLVLITTYSSIYVSILAVGLHENDLVKCALIADVLNLKSVHVTPVSSKDWEIIVSDGCFAAWSAISGQLKIDKSVYIGLAFGAGVRLVFIYTAIAWPALPLTR